ncbi:MAG: META domain-containing protein [Litorimonas sp.]
MSEPPLPTLQNTQWTVTSPNGVAQTLTFGTGNTVSGSTGCNSFSGSVMQSGNALSFGPLASTRRACQEPRQSAERQFFDLLDRTRGANATLQTLTLLGQQGDVLAVLARAG